MANHVLSELESLFERTEEAVIHFMDYLKVKIESASDEYEQLHWHHIYEEEEQRLDRLKDLIPRVKYYLTNSDGQTSTNLEFIHLLQDISLEKFGLHNFEEHIDLLLFKSESPEQKETLTEMRQVTEQDYQKIKELLATLNQKFDGVANRAGSVPTDEKENVDNSLKLKQYVNTEAETDNTEHSINHNSHKRLTVGSLKK